MAIAGTLAVNVIANTTKFVNGLKKATSKLGAFKKRIRTVSKSVIGFGGSLLGVSAAGGLAIFAKNTLEAANTLGQVSNKLGIASEQLELMRFAAERVGISTNTLDMALQRMVRRIGQANLGTGEAVKVLDRMGLSAKKLNLLSPDKQFEAIAKALNKIPDQGGKLAAAMGLFDSEGVALVNVAALNMNEVAKAFERAGGATSQKGIENAQKFADTVQNLQTAAGAAGRDFMIGITPFALDAIKGLLVIMEELGIREKNTALAKIRKARGAHRGLIGTAGTIRSGAVSGLGELIGLLGTDTNVRRGQIARASHFQEDQRRRGILGPSEDALKNQKQMAELIELTKQNNIRDALQQIEFTKVEQANFK